MQYRHSFHAGNFADVHKHITLLALIGALQRKAKGFLYLDTHAGGGLYDLHGEQPRRSSEFLSGVEAMAGSEPRHAEIRDYLAAIARLRSKTSSHSYPGSPLLAAVALREVDRGICIEVVAQEARQLRRSLDAVAELTSAKMRVETGDGYERLIGLLPPPERRALVLVDPPYELADEFVRIVSVLPEALRRLDSAVIAVWFPVKRQRDTDLWLARIARVVERPMLAAQLWLHPRDSAVALNGSGMLIVNPPWQLDERLGLWQEELRQLLGGTGTSGCEVKWLANERP